MAYNPQYCTIIVRNTDGSGYVRQFSTLAEAKAAYAAISSSGASVYLYQPPTRSLSTNPSNTPPPISNTDTQVIEVGIPRNPFDFSTEDNVATATTTKIGCGMVKIKDADGVYTTSPSAPRYRYSYISNGQPASFDENGELNTNGCYYPAGFRIESPPSSFDTYYIETKILLSLDYGGGVYGPYYSVDSLKSVGRLYVIADGNGGTTQETVWGIPSISNDNVITWEQYVDGDIPYKLNGGTFRERIRVGYPIPNGSYLVTYKVTGDERIHSGYWTASTLGTGESVSIKWKFTPVDPTQPPPPPCSVLRKKVNPQTGQVEDECDPTIVYPFTVEENCEPPVVVTIEGQEIVLGENKKTGMNNGYGDITWGPCSGMIYVPNGTLIHSTQTLNYYSNGQGGYYSQGANNCDPQGTVLNENITDIIVEIGGTNYTVGYNYERTIADGNCGSGIETGTEYSPNGTLIVSYNGDNYYSNGSGGYYNCQVNGTLISTVDNPALIMINEIQTLAQTGTYPTSTYANGECGTYTTDGEITYYPSGTNIGSGGGYNFFSNGVGGYYSEEIVVCAPYGELVNTGAEPLTTYITELSQSVTSGNTPVYTYADGSCGTYITYGENSWYPVGTQLASDSSYNYLADGIGGYTLEAISPPCDSSGTFYGSTTEPATIYINELNGYYTAGTYDVNTYADGNCGTYNSNSETYWYSSGTLLTSDSSYNYYSNGSGGYYTEPVGGCTPYGEFLGGDGGTYSVNLGCGDFVLGTWNSTSYADGNCGSYTNGSSDYVPNGTLIGNCNDYNYYSDGMGGYYQGEYTGGGGGCPSYGTELSSDSGYYTVNFGCGDINVGQWGSTTYADGNCGTYNSGGASYYYSNGQLIQNCNDYNYYSDGGSGYYQGEYTGGSGCPSYGTELIPAQSGTYYTSTPCGDFATGSWYDDADYADGNCGYYNDGTSYYNHMPFGEFITNCNDYNLYSDGNDGYYTGEYTGA